MIKTTVKNIDLVRKRQNQICRGAMKVFQKKGFHATSMREIAKATGIGLGNLYDYIGKKEDILFLIHKDILGQLYSRLDQILEKYKNPVEQLVNMIKEIFELDSKLRAEVQFIYTETKSLKKKYLHEILKVESEFVSKIESIIERGIRQGVFFCENPGLLANIVAFNIAILPLRGWNILPRHTKEETLNDLIKFIMRGLGAKIELSSR